MKSLSRSNCQGFYLPLLFILGLCAACAPDDGDDEQGSPSSALEVRIEKIAEVELGAVVKVRGFLESRVDLELSAERDGRVTARPVEESSLVEKGQILLRLDDERARLERDRAKAAVEEARLDPATDAALLRSRELELAMTEEALARCALPAPAGGTLDRIFVEVGEWVRRGETVLRMVDREKLRAVFELNEQQRRDARVGDEVSCSPSRRRNLSVVGQLVRMAIAPDATTGRYRAEVEFAEVPDEILPGMVVEGRLAVATDRRGFKLPKSALLRRYEQWIGFRVEETDGQTLAQEVALTVRPIAGEPAFLEIVTGVEVGDRMILGPLIGLRDGTEILPISDSGR